MIRFGVHRIDQFPGKHPGPHDWLRWGHLDYRLLRTHIPPSEAEVAVFEGVTFRMQLSSGIFRTTSPARFRDLDEWLTPVLQRNAGAAAALDILDWAASDCSTSARWHASLKAAFPNCRLTASDLNVYIIEMIPRDARGVYILDAALGLLQYVQEPFVIRMVPPEPAWLAVNWMLARRARRRFERLWQDGQIDSAAIRFGPGQQEIRKGGFLFRRIPLIHPSALALEQSSHSFRICRHSVFDPAETPADVIRTMNILNAGYFDAPALKRGAENVCRSLRDGGIWIVGRTIREEPALHHVSVLRKSGGRFQLLERYNEKSEAEDAALAVGL